MTGKKRRTTLVWCYITQDWHANRHAVKPRLVLAGFRLAQVAPPPTRKLVRGLYRLMVEWVLGIELPWEVQAGPGLTLYHGQGLVINGGVTLGANCVLRHGVTIGNNGFTACPRIGEGVEFGAHAVVFGDVSVGDHAKIGAGTVITKNVPAGATMVGAAARQL